MAIRLAKVLLCILAQIIPVSLFIGLMVFCIALPPQTFRYH